MAHNQPALNKTRFAKTRIFFCQTVEEGSCFANENLDSLFLQCRVFCFGKRLEGGNLLLPQTHVVNNLLPADMVGGTSVEATATVGLLDLKWTPIKFTKKQRRVAWFLHFFFFFGGGCAFFFFWGGECWEGGLFWGMISLEIPNFVTRWIVDIISWAC